MVRWCTPTQAHGTNLIGVEFTGLNASQTVALETCIARWKSEDAGAGDG
jgi:hypothetical protein